MPVSALKATLPQIGCELLSFSILKLGDPPKKWQTSSIFQRGLTLTWRIWTRPGLGGLWCSRALRRKVKPTRTRTAISNTTWVFFGEFYYEKKEKETITILWNLQFDMSWNWNGRLIFWLLKFDEAEKLWGLFAKSEITIKSVSMACICIFVQIYTVAIAPITIGASMLSVCSCSFSWMIWKVIRWVMSDQKSDFDFVKVSLTPSWCDNWV